jgi:hypothetical protein
MRPRPEYFANFSDAQFALRAANESFLRERRSARRDIGGRRQFAATRRKKHARAKGLEKIGSVIWFALDTRHRAAL